MIVALPGLFSYLFCSNQRLGVNVSDYLGCTSNVIEIYIPINTYRCEVAYHTSVELLRMSIWR